MKNVEKSMYEFVRRLIQCLKGRVLIVVLLNVGNNSMWNSGREEKSGFNISVWTRTSSLEIGVKTGFDIIKYCRKLWLVTNENYQESLDLDWVIQSLIHHYSFFYFS